MKEISIKQAKKLINENIDNNNFLILDVRSSSEYKNGHIEGSKNIYVSDQENFNNSIKGLEKDNIYFVYCRFQNRAKLAANILKNNNFTKIYNIFTSNI